MAVLARFDAQTTIALGIWVLYLVRYLASAVLAQIQGLDENLAEAIQLVAQGGNMEGQNPLVGLVGQILREKVTSGSIEVVPRAEAGKFRKLEEFE